MRKTVEHAVDKAGLIIIEEGLGNVDILGNDHLGRNILAAQKLVGAGAEDSPQQAVDTLQGESSANAV